MKHIAIAVGSLLMLVVPSEAANTAQINREFRSILERVMNSVRNEQEYLRDLSASEFSQFVSCAQDVMDRAPRPDKQYVLAGANLNQQKERFREIANKRPIDSKPTLMQEIAKCS